MNTPPTTDRISRRAIASTPYDTAWVASVPHSLERRDPRFPSALNWIITHQHPDGSWGSDIPFLHDRIICTLAALIPLAQFGRREVDRVQVRRGERYLWQNAHLLASERCDLVGFELLLPTLIARARSVGVQVPPHLDGFGQERANKLTLLPPDKLYSPAVTTVHSLEFLGADVDPLKLLNVRSANGSVGNSPAATAFLLQHVDDSAAEAYLSDCLAADHGSGVPVLEPCETFEALWVAYHRWLSGEPAEHCLSSSELEGLRRALTGTGVSLSPSFPIPDADDTAVALILLHEAAIPVEPLALKQFERDDYFVSFPYERHPSTGVNIHVLQALLRYPSYPQRDQAIEKIVRFLTNARQHNIYWVDKWHISPFYATCRAIVALSAVPYDYNISVQTMVETAVEWLLQMQNEDGSWGFYHTPTCEETAFAILGLRAASSSSDRVRTAIENGTGFLRRQPHVAGPAMWIDKCLYYPSRIVESVIRAAQAPS